MGNLLSRNEFPVKGRTFVITGGSRGMGLAVARQLSERGANVVIVARRQGKLIESLEYINNGAENPQTQRFHQISADLSSASECVRVVDEVVAWNHDNPPDVVWCCAGSSHPTLFVDTPVSVFPEQMNSNYFTSLYMAHAVLAHWVKTPDNKKKMSLRALSEKNTLLDKPNSRWRWTSTKTEEPARHLIFTASFLAFYSFTGYSPYSPAKAALRALSDSLSQEMNLYAAACPDEPRVRLHTVFPATILTQSYDEENLIKPAVTKALEEGDAGQTAEVVAAKSIKALERGQELITTDILTGLVKRSMLGGSVRGGFVAAIIDWFLAGLMGIVMVFVRYDMDQKTRKWGRLLS